MLKRLQRPPLRPRRCPKRPKTALPLKLWECQRGTPQPCMTPTGETSADTSTTLWPAKVYVLLPAAIVVDLVCANACCQDVHGMAESACLPKADGPCCLSSREHAKDFTNEARAIGSSVVVVVVVVVVVLLRVV